MARFCGVIGYAVLTETAPGVWSDVITERTYMGDVVKNIKRSQTSESLNDDLAISNEFSIVADPYAYENFIAIRYIKWMGVRWKIAKIDVQRPRLLISIGGVYNGESPRPTDVT